MNQHFHVEHPEQATPEMLGPYQLGDTPTINGRTLRVVDAPPFYPAVDAEPEPTARHTVAYAWNLGNQQVDRSYPPDPVTVAEAEARKLAQADDRWTQASVAVPLQHPSNGQVVQLSFSREQERSMYGNIPDDDTKHPADGMDCRLLPPGFDRGGGSFTLVYEVKGPQAFALVKQKTFAHECAMNRAWGSVFTEIEIIKAGTGTDAEKVAAIDAIDIEARPAGKTWPSTTVPA